MDIYQLNSELMIIGTAIYIVYRLGKVFSYTINAFIVSMGSMGRGGFGNGLGMVRVGGVVLQDEARRECPTALRADLPRQLRGCRNSPKLWDVKLLTW
jgi:hypothetical protein